MIYRQHILASHTWNDATKIMKRFESTKFLKHFLGYRT